MNTKLLMTLVAVVYGVSGMGCLFLPQEMLTYLGLGSSDPLLVVMLQVLGAAYLGFGMLNWMVKGSKIGGIYNRPVIVANLMHLSVVAITLVKAFSDFQEQQSVLALFTGFYIILALLFGYLLFRSAV